MKHSQGPYCTVDAHCCTEQIVQYHLHLSYRIKNAQVVYSWVMDYSPSTNILILSAIGALLPTKAATVAVCE